MPRARAGISRALAAMQNIEDMINGKTHSSPQNVDDFFKELNLDEKGSL